MNVLSSLSREEKFDTISFLVSVLKQEDDLEGARSVFSTSGLGINNDDEDVEDEDVEDEDVDNIIFALPSPEDDKLVNRWLPRLNDRSSDVREKAAENLATVAKRNSDYQDQLVPLLLKHVLTESDWTVACNGILYPLSDLPGINRLWVHPLLDVYIYLARKADYVTGENAYNYMWRLIQDGFIDKQHPKFPIVLQLATQGEKSTNDDVRAYSISILDWVEDS